MWRSYPPKNGGFEVVNSAKPLLYKVIHQRLGEIIHSFRFWGVDNPYLSTNHKKSVDTHIRYEFIIV